MRRIWSRTRCSGGCRCARRIDAERVRPGICVHVRLLQEVRHMAKRLIVTFLTVCFASITGAAGKHTLVVLSHNDHTAYELDPASGKILQSFKAIDQPHEGVVSADGKT